MSPPDLFIEALYRRACQRAHDAERAEVEVCLAPRPASPEVADQDHPTPAERAAIVAWLEIAERHSQMCDAARAEHEDAQRAHEDAYRLYTGHELRSNENGTATSLLAYATVTRGAPACFAGDAPPPVASVTPPAPRSVQPRTAPRARGAGRPGHRTTRSSAASGDSGDDSPAGPPPPALRLWRHPQYGLVNARLLRLLVRLTGGDR